MNIVITPPGITTNLVFRHLLKSILLIVNKTCNETNLKKPSDSMAICKFLLRINSTEHGAMEVVLQTPLLMVFRLAQRVNFK